MLLGAQLEAPSSLKTRKTCPASQARGPLKLDAGYFAQLEIKIAHWPEGRVTRGSAAPAVWGADLWGGLPCHQRRGCRGAAAAWVAGRDISFLRAGTAAHLREPKRRLCILHIFLAPSLHSAHIPGPDRG